MDLHESHDTPAGATVSALPQIADCGASNSVAASAPAQQDSAEVIAHAVAAEVLHYIDTMYPAMWGAVAKGARTSIRNMIIGQSARNDNGYYWGGPHSVSGTKQLATARKAYRDLWESINGAGSWAANPWVWCVEFSKVTP